MYLHVWLLPHAGYRRNRYGFHPVAGCWLAPSPAVAGEGWDGGVIAVDIVPIPAFPRHRGKEPAVAGQCRQKPQELR